MTTDEMKQKALDAGRELDALVAEKVMGAVWQNMTPAGRKKVLSFPKDRPMITTDGGRVTYHGMDGGNLPHYSTDIAAAWEVVEKVSSMPEFAMFDLDVVPVGVADPMRFSARVVLTDAVRVCAETAPRAICLAALQAIGAKVQA